MSRRNDAAVGVVNGFDPTLNYARLAQAALAIRSGAFWVATNTDATVPAEAGRTGRTGRAGPFGGGGPFSLESNCPRSGTTTKIMTIRNVKSPPPPGGAANNVA